jgi:ribosome-binding protein aMBF1 (putative translation factor)
MKELSINNEKMVDIYKKIGKNVREKRNEKGISQLKLALQIGHNSVGTVSMCELYTNKKHFNLEHLVKIADVLEIDICDLLQGIDIEKDMD